MFSATGMEVKGSENMVGKVGNTFKENQKEEDEDEEREDIMVAHVFVGEAEMDEAYHEAAKEKRISNESLVYSRCPSDDMFEDWMIS